MRLDLNFPGVLVEEGSFLPRTIAQVDTTMAVFIGRTQTGPRNAPTVVNSFLEFEALFGHLWEDSAVSFAVRDYFANGGMRATIIRLFRKGGSNAGEGAALKAADFLGKGLSLFSALPQANILCLPTHLSDQDYISVVRAFLPVCESKHVFLVIDPLLAWTDAPKALSAANTLPFGSSPAAAVYFPRLRYPSVVGPANSTGYAPCGAVAGKMVETDLTRGVWKAPAGMSSLTGVASFTVPLNSADSGDLNLNGVNCLRTMSGGPVVWGARLLGTLTNEIRYVNQRRFVWMLSDSLSNGLSSTVFEPNAERLWAKLRSDITLFLHVIWRQGGLMGAKPEEAFFVRCDATTTTQQDIAAGKIVCRVGLALARPSEFFLLELRLKAAA